MGNTFGTIFTLTSFGESHGVGIGGVIDGMPPGIPINVEFIQQELRRRRPGQSKITTQRKEKDCVEILSGVFNGITTGCPIGFLVRNEEYNSADYDDLRDVFRPSHADYTYSIKYDSCRDYRGGGRSSARITISRCVAGAFAKLALRTIGVTIKAYTSQIGDIVVGQEWLTRNLDEVENNPVRCPDPKIGERMMELIERVMTNGDTIGGTVTCVIRGCKVGWGEPEFDKLHARLSSAMLSINAAKGFDYGLGFNGLCLKGSEQNDPFVFQNGAISTTTNHSGGIQGGISNGQDIYFRVAFKPVATLLMEQNTVNKDGESVTMKPHGRHDPCVLPRAVPIVEAMAAMTLLDCHLLMCAHRGFKYDQDCR